MEDRAWRHSRIEDVVRGTQGALVGGRPRRARDRRLHRQPHASASARPSSPSAGRAPRRPRLPARRRRRAARPASWFTRCPTICRPSVPIVLVDDTTRALGRLAAYHRARFTVPVAAVTGSNGKTTTKEMMAAVLGRARARCSSRRRSFNNQWGLPLTLLRSAAEHRALALELGANTPGEIAALAAIAGPRSAPSRWCRPPTPSSSARSTAWPAEKSALVRAIPPDGAVVLNADDPRVLAMRAPEPRRACSTFSTRGRGRRPRGGRRSRTTREGVALHARDRRRGRRPVRLALRGPAQRDQRARRGRDRRCALGLAARADRPRASRRRARPRGAACGGARAALRILDDTYNANPASVRAALETLGAAAGARAAGGGAGRHARAGRDRGGRAPGDGPRGRRVGRGRVRRLGRAGPDRGRGGARRPGSPRAITRPPSRTRWRCSSSGWPPATRCSSRARAGMRMERVVDALIARFGGEDG